MPVPVLGHWLLLLWRQKRLTRFSSDSLLKLSLLPPLPHPMVPMDPNEAFMTRGFPLPVPLPERSTLSMHHPATPKISLHRQCKRAIWGSPCSPHDPTGQNPDIQERALGHFAFFYCEGFLNYLSLVNKSCNISVFTFAQIATCYKFYSF